MLIFLTLISYAQSQCHSQTWAAGASVLGPTLWTPHCGHPLASLTPLSKQCICQGGMPHGTHVPFQTTLWGLETQKLPTPVALKATPRAGTALLSSIHTDESWQLHGAISSQRTEGPVRPDGKGRQWAADWGASICTPALVSKCQGQDWPKAHAISTRGDLDIRLEVQVLCPSVYHFLQFFRL